MKRLRIVILIAALLATSAAAAPGSAGGGPPGPSASGAIRTHLVTLVTGAVVEVGALPDGRPTATVDPHSPGAEHGFQLTVRDGDVYVVPNEAAPYLAAGQLDEALFNVSDLAAEGYDDRSRATLPLLLSARGPAGGPPAVAAGTVPATPPATPPAATRRGELRSIATTAVHQDKAQARRFWESIVDPAGRRLADGLGKVWLDRKVRATLEESVPQVGAPHAWAAGVDGSGVKVAVLDTGYDATHPDLAGRMVTAQDFTGEGSAADGHGHGTHVAAIVAGSGAAAGGTRRGMAPGAELMVGRVLDAHGTGDLSWIIAGMEWAVAQGADVVNLSLGAGPSDGTDPLSTAVNSLTASSGTLFVAAAGNAGPGESTVQAPGAATAALTVGAVDDSDALAAFSGRGPRYGDGAVKPELTAPGVGIIAARAAGTSLGNLVDARYTSLSGTSMAAPHVAGAAALLADLHPQWSAAELKAALVGSARPLSGPGVGVGAGRLDVAAAVRRSVLADTASIGLGRIEWAGGHAAPVTTQVTYRNTSDRTVTLDLTAGAQAAGTPPANAALTVTPTRLTLTPGARATAELRLDPKASRAGTYTGLLRATGADAEVRIPLGFIVEGRTATLTATALDREGRPADGNSQMQLWNLDTGELFRGHFWGAQATVVAPVGRYALMLYIDTIDESWSTREVTVLGEPETTVDDDRGVHFDARRATPLHMRTSDPTTADWVGVAWQRVVGERSILTGFGFPGAITSRYSTAPTEPVTIGSFEFVTQFNLAAPALTARVGDFQLPPPLPVDGTPRLEGHLALPLVDGGDGSPAELARAKGAAALLRFAGYDELPAQLAAAAEAGARAVLLRPDTPGFWAAGAWGAQVPAYSLELSTADRLRELLARQPRVTIALTGVAETPYRYQLLLTERGRIPANLSYDTARLPLATVESEFHDLGAGKVGKDSRLGATPTGLAAFSASHQITTPSRRTDHFTTGENGAPIIWRHDAAPELGFWQARGYMYGLPRTYRAGERTHEVWFPAVNRPAVPAVGANLDYGAPVNRKHDAIRVAVPHYASGGADQYGWADYNSDRTRLVLRRGDTVIGDTPWPYAQFVVPEEAGTYRLTLEVARDRNDGPQWWTTSTATTTTWTFRSGRPANGAAEVLPLLQMEYGIETDLRNTVRASGSYPLVVRPGYQPGAAARGPVTVGIEISYDDGATWRGVDTVANPDGSLTAHLPRVEQAGFVTLRVDARDADGNRLEQTIRRAWRVAPA